MLDQFCICKNTGGSLISSLGVISDEISERIRHCFVVLITELLEFLKQFFGNSDCQYLISYVLFLAHTYYIVLLNEISSKNYLFSIPFHGASNWASGD